MYFRFIKGCEINWQANNNKYFSFFIFIWNRSTKHWIPDTMSLQHAAQTQLRNNSHYKIFTPITLLANSLSTLMLSLSPIIPSAFLENFLSPHTVQLLHKFHQAISCNIFKKAQFQMYTLRLQKRISDDKRHPYVRPAVKLHFPLV